MSLQQFSWYYSAYPIWNAQDDHQTEVEGLLKFAGSGLAGSFSSFLKLVLETGAHCEEISVVLQVRFDGHLEHFKEDKHCKYVDYLSSFESNG